MEAGLADAIAHVPIFVRRLDGRIVHWTPGCGQLFGHAAGEAEGALAHELLRTVLPEPRETIEAALLTRGEWSGRLRHVTATGEELWTESVWRLRDSQNPGGKIVIEQHTDVTDRVALEQKSALLARELEHRVKNILNVVQSLARMSFPDAPEAQRNALDRRIIALSEANKVLQDASWQEADLRTIVAEVSTRLGVAERLACKGPPVAISSEQAMGLALVVHELCTNALKYGALTRDGGRIGVTWDVDPKDSQLVRLRWQERGGPAVEPPRYKGFGMLLIRRAVTGPDGAAADLRFEPGGVVCDVTLLKA